MEKILESMYKQLKEREMLKRCESCRIVKNT